MICQLFLAQYSCFENQECGRFPPFIRYFQMENAGGLAGRLFHKSVGKYEGDAHRLAALVVAVNYGAKINEGGSFAS